MWALIHSAPAHAEETPVLDQYLKMFQTMSADDLPLTNDVTFDGTLLQQQVSGRQAVVSFLNTTIPRLGFISVSVRQKFETSTGACAEMVFEYKERGSLEYAHCLEIEDGRIAAIRLYFDPRPFLQKQP